MTDKGYGMHGMGMDPEKVGKGPKRPLPRQLTTLPGLLDHAEEYVREWWLNPEREADDAFLPMLIAVCRNGEVVPVLAPFRSEDEKASFTNYIREQLKNWRVDRYVMITEAWMAGADEGKTPPEKIDTPPSKRADRDEVMMLIAADKHKARGRMLLMDRNDVTGKVISLERIHDEIENAGTYSGRFADLLMPERVAVDMPDAETISYFKIALSLQGADPSRIDDYEATKARGERIWHEIETAMKLSESRSAVVRREAALRMGDAMREARELLKGLISGWYRRDGKPNPFADL